MAVITRRRPSSLNSSSSKAKCIAFMFLLAFISLCMSLVVLSDRQFSTQTYFSADEMNMPDTARERSRRGNGVVPERSLVLEKATMSPKRETITAATTRPTTRKATTAATTTTSTTTTTPKKASTAKSAASDIKEKVKYAFSAVLDQIGAVKGANYTTTATVTDPKQFTFAIPNAIPRPQPIQNPESEVMLVLHTNVNKFDNLWVNLKWWKGPSSIAIQLSAWKDIDTFFAIYNVHKKRDYLQRATFHLFLDPPAPSKIVVHPLSKEKQLLYPHNMLRNFGMNHMDGVEYFVGLDVDLIPSQNSYDRMKEFVHKNSKLLQHNKTLFIVPAFDVMPLTTQETLAAQKKLGRKVRMNDLLPKTQHELIEKWKIWKVEPFQRKTCPAGHGHTNFQRWKKYVKKIWPTEEDIAKGKPTDYYPIEYELKFEPYILAYRPGLPQYWEGFRGFAYNKWSWFLELHVAGYNFATMAMTDDAFLCHLSHERYSAGNSRKPVRKRNKPHYHSFLKHLEGSYPDSLPQKANTTFLWEQ